MEGKWEKAYQKRENTKIWKQSTTLWIFSVISVFQFLKCVPVFSLHVYLYTTCVLGVHRGQKWALDLVPSCGCWGLSQVLWKNRQCSKLLRILPACKWFEYQTEPNFDWSSTFLSFRFLLISHFNISFWLFLIHCGLFTLWLWEFPNRNWGTKMQQDWLMSKALLQPLSSTGVNKNLPCLAFSECSGFHAQCFCLPGNHFLSCATFSSSIWHFLQIVFFFFIPSYFGSR